MMRSGKNPMVLPLLFMLCAALFAGCGSSGKETGAAPGTSEATQEETVPSSEPAPVKKELEARWQSGNISDLAGRYDPQAAQEADGLLGLLQSFTKVSLPEIAADAAFPLEVPLTVTTPDLAGILTELHYETYESSEQLSADVQKVLDKGGYPERTVTVDITVEKDGDTYTAQPNPEACFAFYGGLAELYMQEYEKYLEEIANELGGQAP